LSCGGLSAQCRILFPYPITCGPQKNRSLAVAASMRRPLPVKVRVGFFCTRPPVVGADQREAGQAPGDRGPLSLIPVDLREGEPFVKGARFGRGLRTLDKGLAFGSIRAEGKGAGGLRGLAPWRSMRQRLMRRAATRFPAPLLSGSASRARFHTHCGLPLILAACPQRHCRHASIRTLLRLPPRAHWRSQFNRVLPSQ
jgi:hypothetical protein